MKTTIYLNVNYKKKQYLNSRVEKKIKKIRKYEKNSEKNE